MIDKDYKWLCHCIAVIEIHSTDSEYKAFLNDLNKANSMFQAKAIIHRWYMGVI